MCLIYCYMYYVEIGPFGSNLVIEAIAGTHALWGSSNKLPWTKNCEIGNFRKKIACERVVLMKWPGRPHKVFKEMNML